MGTAPNDMLSKDDTITAPLMHTALHMITM